MLHLQSGMKYRQRIDQKLSLAAREPTGELCDIDRIEEDIFQDKTPAEVAAEVKNHSTMENASNSKKRNKKKVKRSGATTNGAHAE